MSDESLCSIDNKNILVAKIDYNKLLALLLDDSTHKDVITNFVTLDKNVRKSLTICYKSKIVVFYNSNGS